MINKKRTFKNLIMVLCLILSISFGLAYNTIESNAETMNVRDFYNEKAGTVLNLGYQDSLLNKEPYDWFPISEMGTLGYIDKIYIGENVKYLTSAMRIGAAFDMTKDLRDGLDHRNNFNGFEVSPYNRYYASYNNCLYTKDYSILLNSPHKYYNEIGNILHPNCIGYYVSNRENMNSDFGLQKYDTIVMFPEYVKSLDGIAFEWSGTYSINEVPNSHNDVSYIITAE